MTLPNETMVEALRNENILLMEKFDTACAKLEHDITEAYAKNAELEKSVNSLQLDLAIGRQAVKNYNDVATHLQGEVTALREQLTTSEVTRGMLGGVVTGIQRDLEDERLAAANMRQEILYLSGLANERLQKIATMADEARDLYATITELKVDMDALKQSLVNARTDRDRLQNRYNDLAAGIDELSQWKHDHAHENDRMVDAVVAARQLAMDTWLAGGTVIPEQLRDILKDA